MTTRSTMRLAVALLVMAVLSSAQPSAQDSSTSAITTPDQAVELALEYTGFDDTTHASVGAIDEPVLAPTPHDSLSPVQYSELDGRQAWRVTMREVVLKIEHAGPTSSNAKHPKDIEVYIDASNGAFLKAIASYSGEDHRQKQVWESLLRSAVARYHKAHLSGLAVDKSLLVAIRERCAMGARIKTEKMGIENPIGARHPLSYRETEFYYLIVPDPSESASPSDSVVFWLVVGKDFAVEKDAGEGAIESRAVPPSILYWPVELDVEKPCRLCMIAELTYSDPNRTRKYRLESTTDTTSTPIDSSLRRRE